MAESWSDYRRDRERQRQRSSDRERRRTQQGPSRRELRRRRKLFVRLFITAAALLILSGILYYFICLRIYHGTKILQTSSNEDTVSTGYEEMSGKILRYSTNGVSLVNRSLESQWSYVYSMDNPFVKIKEGHAVIADLDGNSMVILNEHGVTGTVNTSYSIVKACVSGKGLVAAILDGGEDTWINFYSSDGSLIAQNQTSMAEDGYPLDLALSENGAVLMVTFQCVNGSETNSYVAFYNFGDVGQNAENHIVSGYTYEGTVIPQIEYLDQIHSVAFRDDGFTVYTGNQIPKESQVVTVDKEIVSTFCDGKTIGLIFRNDQSSYRMDVYSAAGEHRFSFDFNIEYTTVRMGRGYIMMYNQSQLCVVSDTGKQRFLGTVDGTIRSCCRFGMNRYLLVMDNGVNVIKLT